MSNSKFLKKGEKKSKMDAFRKIDDKLMGKIAGGGSGPATSAPAAPLALTACVHNETI
jgi:hypothetical protein